MYICLGYTPDGIVLVGGYYVTCLDLLFSKRSRTDLYLDARWLIMRIDAQNCPRTKMWGTSASVLDQGHWVQFYLRAGTMLQV